MKNIPALLIALFMFASIQPADAQFKNLGKKLKKKVQDRIDRKVDKAAEDGLDKVEDGIEDGVKGEGDEEPNEEAMEDRNEDQKAADVSNNPGTPNNPSNGSTSSGTFAVNTKFDYVPGSKLMVFEDFEADAVGDFPARWNTDGTGEVVTFGAETDKWFRLKSGSTYLPDLPYELPESYTIEFDVVARGLDQKTSSSTVLDVVLDDNNGFRGGSNRAQIRIPFCQYHPIGFYVRNAVDNKAIVNNKVEADIRKQVLNVTHVSIAVNKSRYRLWVNETKYIDVPRLVPVGKITAVKFQPYYFKDGKEDIFIRNLKIAEGGLDLRAQLLKDGKVSTNGILFDVNSATIKPESYGVIREIALAMEGQDMKVKIIGHTDSDGETASNLTLSEKRAQAVKTSLVDHYGIDAARLQIEGMGEGNPVEDNSTSEGKAANRRVEFVVL